MEEILTKLKKSLVDHLTNCVYRDEPCIDNCKVQELRGLLLELYNAGMNESWKLAINLRYMDFDEKCQVFGLDDYVSEAWIKIMESFTPQEVKEKLNKWNGNRTVTEQPRFNVGDVVHLKNYTNSDDFAIIATSEELDENGQALLRNMRTNKIRFALDKDLVATDRHIDINFWFGEE